MAAQITDANIPVDCNECAATYICDGLIDLENHLVLAHDYSLKDAEKFGRLWADDAYGKEDERNRKLTMDYKRSHP